jgi:hypothetical protein
LAVRLPIYVTENQTGSANEAEEALANGAITAKIKSKMVLDDLVKARNINRATSTWIRISLL